MIAAIGSVGMAMNHGSDVIHLAKNGRSPGAGSRGGWAAAGVG